MATPGAPSKKDFVSDQEVRWCPGCGDYAILSAAQQVFAELGVPREKRLVTKVFHDTIGQPIAVLADDPKGVGKPAHPVTDRTALDGLRRSLPREIVVGLPAAQRNRAGC